MKFTQEQIDKIKCGSEVGLGVSFVLMVVLGLIPEIWGIHIPKSVMSIVLTCLFLSFAVLIVSSFWATDEEKEERKKEIKDAIIELSKENKISKASTIIPVQNVYNPYADGILDEQKKKVEKILLDLPSHHEKRDQINMSEVSRYLTALEELKIISPTKSADLHNLRLWVESVTGKHAPEQYRFNDAFPSTNKQGVKKAKEKIKQVLEI